MEFKPDYLHYYAPLTGQSTDYITVTNTGDQRYVFKVKTTSPKLYCVRPTAAIVKPGEEVKVEVIFLGLTEEPVPEIKCKDKFLVIALPAPYDLKDTPVTEAWPELEAEFKKDSVSKKIKVKYVMEPKQKEHVLAVSDTTVQDTIKANRDGISDEKLQEERTTSITEDTNAPLSTASSKIVDTGSSVVDGSIETEAGPNSFLIILIALLVLLLGWLYY
ncbi:hypothetical protein KAFR_0L01920 [Kazachstania africana CBS 2517]|uniref:MSP domain-containing protein n=1 Tax=Kazachstania africana (strain ATCC 22294 / BCRC 22015 / CBS 2517 / CECT 1963 / NBRC 1671 / NRRL Y-8276) TaxID=1071382 RepID=H2B2F2_KAZAF|nr:hypothetical protein KAFR_0L01920 [Kazachstania africana CBS 2517]CCF60802.1 hypothetical protein KAFR_0L01920 [Kazachstania africana CBS 2517]